jgi:hypothetical protein
LRKSLVPCQRNKFGGSERRWVDHSVEANQGQISAPAISRIHDGGDAAFREADRGVELSMLAVPVQVACASLTLSHFDEVG